MALEDQLTTDLLSVVGGRDFNMGFIKKFLKTTYRDNTAGKSRSSFESLSEDQLETHLRIAKYGQFNLIFLTHPKIIFSGMKKKDI